MHMVNRFIQKKTFAGHKETGFLRLAPNIGVSLWIASFCGLILMVKPEVILALPSDVAVWLTFVTLVVLSVIAWHQALGMGDNPWISPLFLHIAVILTFQTASGLLLAIHWELVTPITNWDPRGLTNLLEYLPKVSWLILIGAMGAYIGLLFPVRFLTVWLPRLNWGVGESRFCLRAGLFMPLIIISFYLCWKPGILPPSLQQVGWSLGEFGKVVFIAGIMQILSRGKSAKWWKVIVIVWVILYIPFVLFGVRSTILWPLVFFVWTYLAVKKHLSRKLLVGTVAFLFLFVVVLFPLLTVYKYARSEPKKLSIGEAFRKTTESISVKDRNSSVTALFLEIVRIQTLPGFFIANYIQYYPEVIPYLKGESFVMVMSAMIPRLIIPDKPDVWFYINKLSYDVNMGHSRSLETSSTYIDAISEFYINFGSLGVFILSILQGAYLQARFDWLIRRSKFSLGFPVYAAGFFGSSAFWHVLVLDSKNFIVWITILWLLSYRNTSASKVQA